MVCQSLGIVVTERRDQALHSALFGARRHGRSVAGRPPREDWTIVESKLRRRKGDYRGAGLVILPKE
jgi:hypothetical protein